MPWQVYEVRRVIRPGPMTPPARRTPPRSLHAVAAGNRAQMTTVLRKMAKAEGAGIQDEDGIERVLAAPPQHGIPAVGHFLVAAPAGPLDKDGPGARLRDSLAGGSIRSRRPARESGRNTEWAQIPDSSPPFRAFPCLRSVTAARRAIGKLTALWAGGSSGRPAEGHRKASTTGPRKAADAIVASMAVQRRPQQGAVWYAPDPGHGGCCRNSREAATSPCRRPRTARRAASPAARPVPFAGTASATAADLAAGLRGVPALPGSQVAGGVFLRVPRGAILLPVMAGGAWRGNSAVYVGAFCGSEEEGCQAPFQGCAEDGYRATGERAYLYGAYSGICFMERLLGVVATRRLPGLKDLRLGRLRRRGSSPASDTRPPPMAVTFGTGVRPPRPCPLPAWMENACGGAPH